MTLFKKISFYFSGFIVLLCVVVALVSRSTGVGVKISNGRYLGYSANTHEWLLFQYPNIPVSEDGPYVFYEQGRRIARVIKGDGQSAASMAVVNVSNEVTVTVDDELKTTFQVSLRDAYPRSKLDVPQPDTLLALSDLEGNFLAMVDLLAANGVIDESLNWVYGAGHVVFIGEMVDRGRNVVPLLWLIYKLEAQAQESGGYVHYVLGNHERYLLDGRVKSVASKYFGTFRATGMGPSELWSANTELGRWLRSKPAMLKVGDTLFVHGGVSPSVLSKNPTLESIDEEVASDFVLGDSVRRNVSGSVLHDSAGLLFYRGLSQDMSEHGLGKKANPEHVAQVLKHFQVNRIAIGHTLVDHIAHDYGGAVIRVDVDHALGTSEALLIENGAIRSVNSKAVKRALESVESE